jgi:hypothetical protein
MAKARGNPDNQVSYWTTEIERAKKRYRPFHDAGETVIDAYRLQKADGNDLAYRDKYNILYSSTETMRPQLYSNTPKVRVVMRSKDTATDSQRLGALLIEGCVKYIQDEEQFDAIMDQTVDDYLLPGMGQAWVRYEPTFGEDNKLLDEMVKLDYVYWADFLTGVGRTWEDVPWVAKRLWLTKERAKARFGPEIASNLTYVMRESSNRDQDTPSDTAEVWEIWDKAKLRVVWYSEGLDKLIDTKTDPLRLKKFFPCPKPIRAIHNTRSFVPRSLYSQYRSQAETLNVLTRRIRLLGEALRVVGFYDGQHTALADALNPNAGNKMIAVDSWAAFAQSGGMAGNVVWLPIDQIVKVLNELLQAREVCKQEIYEITGFSDIVRGVSKASETLGAQNIKANFASARIRKMQREIQRFAKDLLALVGEVVSEHCSPETIALFSGLSIPDPEQVRVNPQLQQRMQLFKEATDLIRNEMRRVSSIDIETDSTLLADDEQERADRSQFLSAAGAFLQQAVPAMEATPELGPLLGALLMFTVRTFPSSRPIEEEFERVQQAMANRQPQQDKDGKQAKAAVDQAKLEQTAKIETDKLQVQREQAEADRALEAQKEANRHSERMLELGYKERELELRERELAFKERELEEQVKLDKFKALHEAGMREEEQEREAEEREADRTHEAEEREADRTQEYDRMDRDAEEREADRETEREPTKEG